MLIGVVLVSCAPQVQAPTQILTESGTASTGTVSVNDRTPETTDSLEVPTTGSGQTVIKPTVTEGGTILFGETSPRLTEYFDYDCTYCRRFALADRSWINTEYAATGRISVEIIFAPQTPLGTRLAQAAVCAAEQGKYSEMDALLLAGTPADDKGITDAAKKLKLKTDEFSACMKRTDVIHEATDVPEERVPSFRLGETTWVGILSREELQQALNEGLRR